MMFEAMAFKVCPIHIKLSTSNSKRRCLHATAPFFAPLRGCFLITAWKFNLSGPLGHLPYEGRLYGLRSEGAFPKARIIGELSAKLTERLLLK